MLVSLKAGNAGLNLVAASQVIIFDPFWNPYIEEQAIDRAHRLGQTRPVQVHRILVEKTVEDRILELQDKKREVIEGALDEHAASQISRLGVRELKFLFVSPIPSHPCPRLTVLTGDTECAIDSSSITMSLPFALFIFFDFTSCLNFYCPEKDCFFLLY
jgi:hypothetical protein